MSVVRFNREESVKVACRVGEAKGLRPKTLARARKRMISQATQDPHRDELFVPEHDMTEVKYERLLRQAKIEGRVNGSHSCPVCGSHYNDKEAASACCKQ